MSTKSGRNCRLKAKPGAEQCFLLNKAVAERMNNASVSLNYLPIVLAGCNSLRTGLSSIAAHIILLIGRQAGPAEILRCVGKPTDHGRKNRGHPGKTAVWIAQFAD